MPSRPLLTLLLAALVGCGDTGEEPAPRTGPPAASGYPSSISVLGDSGSTGQNSDPDRPGFEARENSWATGTNPEVNSVYSRILTRNPRIDGRAGSLSQGGAGVTMVSAQASELLATAADTELIIVQVGDNDLTCPLDRSALADFKTQLTALLRKLANGAPHARVFVVSRFGTVNAYARSLTRAERASQGGTGPCDFMTPSGGIGVAKAARVQHAIDGYETARQSACESVPSCTYDGGALSRIVDRRKYVSSDLNHLSIAGHAKVAAETWRALHQTGVIPSKRANWTDVKGAGAPPPDTVRACRPWTSCFAARR